MHDVVLIGAGPAGLHAARLLGERALDVVVLEEHEAVGRPVHCTGILAAAAFDEFDLPTAAILNPLETARFTSPGGRTVSYRSPTIEAVVVDRAAFDAHLAARAVAAGARLRCRTRVRGVHIAADGVTVDVDRGQPVRARACVLACGARYALHRTLGLDRPGLLLHTAQAELPAAHPGDVELYFGSAIAPKGFAWAVPVTRGDRSYARIGVMCDGPAADYFARMVRRVAATWGLDDRVVAAPRLKALPLTAAARTYGDRLLVVGDAAGIVKPTTGGGIYYSLSSAALAAGILADALRGDDLGAAALSVYERRWRELFETELTTQLELRNIAQRMSDEDIDDLFALAQTDGIRSLVQRTATFNRHRALILALLQHPSARRIFYRSMLA